MNAGKEQIAIDRLKCFEPETEPYWLCYSGGKDSDCIRILAELSGVKYEIHHNVTSVDAPETMAYVKTIPNVIFDRRVDDSGKPVTMWNLIPKQLSPPTRLARYCCKYLKEWGGVGHVKVTGVRMSESKKRADSGGMVKVIGKPKTMQKYAEENDVDYKLNIYGGLVLNMDNGSSRRMVEHCYRTTQTILNPIYDWEEDDVWDFLHHYGCESNPLYKCNRKRIGCLGCPLQSNKGKMRDFKEYPKYKNLYLHAFDRMLKRRLEVGKPAKIWRTAQDVYEWYVDGYNFSPGQQSFFDEE